MNETYFRHGDVHGFKIDKIPDDAQPIKENALAYGEVTGHAHRFYGNATLFETPDKRRFLRVVEPVELRHEEHHTRIIPPGDFEIKKTPEADHMEGIVREVAD